MSGMVWKIAGVLQAAISCRGGETKGRRTYRYSLLSVRYLFLSSFFFCTLSRGPNACSCLHPYSLLRANAAVSSCAVTMESFGGKLHIGFVDIRRKLESIQKERETRRAKRREEEEKVREAFRLMSTF